MLNGYSIIGHSDNRLFIISLFKDTIMPTNNFLAVRFRYGLMKLGEYFKRKEEFFSLKLPV